MSFALRPHQIEAVENIHSGCILNGDVGSGKSITALAYFYLKNGGSYDFLLGGNYRKMNRPQDLYIITTAAKRDKLEWDKDMGVFLLSRTPTAYKHKVVVDSWNNIGKYATVKNAFFILDEQRLVGYGAWAQAFFKIAKFNEWIMLTATPGDKWIDYMTVFIANGYYKHKTDFVNQHVIYNPRVVFPQISRYFNTNKLERERSAILVDMNSGKNTTQHHEYIHVDYDKLLYKSIIKKRWNYQTNKPLRNVSEMCYLLRYVTNSDPSRKEVIHDLCLLHNKVIIFYNFDYELDILRNIDYGSNVEVREWNGHKHEEIPKCDNWIYLVQYTSGCEGWNCTETDTIIFYSENYSYRIMFQAAGRIDRLNTPFKDLYYYHMRSTSPIDIGIHKALSEKKTFNERGYKKYFEKEKK